jgi:hypothetical protein
MSLKPNVASLDAVPEKYRDLYSPAESGEGFVLQVEGVEDTAALKKALKSERETAKLAKAWQAAFPDATPEQIAALVKKATEQPEPTKKGKASEDEEVQRLLKKREDEIRGEYEPKVKAGDAAQQELRSLKLDVGRRAAALKAGILPDAIDDALTLSSKHFDLDEKGRPVVLDEDGDPSSMSVEKFFATKFKEAKPHLYKGTGASGSGAEQTAGRGAPADTSKMSPTEKIAAGLAARS